MPAYWNYNPQFLSRRTADCLLTFCNSLEFHEYPVRGQHLKRSPKVEFSRDGTVGPYRWGQQKEAYDWVHVGFPEILDTVAQQLGDSDVNHCIIIRYSNGRTHHIPWHHDKQEGVPGVGAHDIRQGTTIYNVVVCEPWSARTFQLAHPLDLDNPIFSQAMPHGSCIEMSADANKELVHRVPKEKKVLGNRYSLVFRSIKSKRW